MSSHLIRSEDFYAEVCSPWMQYEIGSHPLPGEDIDLRLERDVYGIVHEADGNLLEPLTWELYGEGDACMVVLSQPVSKQPPPQTEVALAMHIDRDVWKATDQVEIDTLFVIPAMEEYWDEPSNVPRAWKTRFVRSVKEKVSTNQLTPRSRLVMVGPGHVLGIEYHRADAPTPAWATTEMVMITGCVKGGTPFQFDLKQFFQTVDVDTPSGELIAIPPPRYQRKDGNMRLYWRMIKWLQGARGAGRAAHLAFLAVVMDPGNDFDFVASIYDPCYLHHIGEDGEIHFTIHVDDGIGWASTPELAAKLRAVLAKVWADIKWQDFWADIMGFDVEHDRVQRTLKFSARKHIGALRALVAEDCSFTPKSPYAQDINAVELFPPPEQIGSIEHQLFINRASFCKQAIGSLRQIVKVRPDLAGPVGIISRFAHAPCEAMPKHVKHVCLYAIGTIDAGPMFGGRACSFEDLSLPADLPDSYVLDVDGPKLWYYHVVLDGSLSAKDRSRSCILHMYAGACFNALSFTQHSIAKDANDSEVFTASSGGAQSVPYRGILHEMQVSMHARSPIFSDSRSTRLISISASAMKQAIYLARRVLYMREGIDDGEYAFYQVDGKMNPADGGTKYIGILEFVRARRYGVMSSRRRAWWRRLAMVRVFCYPDYACG